MNTQCQECGGYNSLHFAHCSKAAAIFTGLKAEPYFPKPVTAIGYLGNQQAGDRNEAHRSMPKMDIARRAHEHEKLFQEWWAGFHDPNVGHMEHSIQRHAARSLMNYLLANFKPSDN